MKPSKLKRRWRHRCYRGISERYASWLRHNGSSLGGYWIVVTRTTSYFIPIR